jgi:hypothetical protein
MTVSAQNTVGKPRKLSTRRSRWENDDERALIWTYVQEHPEATVREIMSGCSISSTSKVHRYLQDMRADLCVCPTCGGKGSIRTTAPERGASQRGR